MKPSPDSPPASDEPDFEQSLLEVERSLQALKDRYAQIKRDQSDQQELQQRLRQTQNQYQRRPDPALSAELKHIKKQLEELELALESQLFSWSGLKEIFWLAVRCGGLGIVVGWLLKTWAG